MTIVVTITTRMPDEGGVEQRRIVHHVAPEGALSDAALLVEAEEPLLAVRVRAFTSDEEARRWMDQDWRGRR